MPLTISRLFNFVNDKNNGIPITSSRVDAELNQLVATLNQSVIATATTPASPFNGLIWFDLNTDFVKAYRNNEFVIMGIVHYGTVMTTPQSGDAWIDNSGSEIVYNVRNKANSAWIPLPTLAVNVFTGTQKWAKGANVASATTTTLGEDGNSFIITGTTTITSITIKAAGTIIVLGFNGILTLTNGSNLILAGNLVTTSGTTITLISDGTNWNELCRNPIPQVGLGAWVSKSSGTTYQAATDGIVVGFGAMAVGASLAMYTDSSSSPTTQRVNIISTVSTGNINGSVVSGFMPVKKNDYWVANGAGTAWTTLFFIPLGS